jgi:hypothetical protein
MQRRPLPENNGLASTPHCQVVRVIARIETARVRHQYALYDSDHSAKPIYRLARSAILS